MKYSLKREEASNRLTEGTATGSSAGIILCTYVYHGFCLEDWVLWLLFILVSDYLGYALSPLHKMVLSKLKELQVKFPF